MRAVAIGRGGGKLAPADEALVKGLDGPRRLGDLSGAEPIGRSGAEIEQGPRAGEERGDAVSEVHEARRITPARPVQVLFIVRIRRARRKSSGRGASHTILVPVTG